MDKKLGIFDFRFSIFNRQSSIVNRQWLGFTLTEVVLVVVILALVGGVGGGIYVGTHKRMLVEKAARDFVLTAQYARIMAIEQQSRYTMQLDAANNGFWLTTAARAKAWTGGSPPSPQDASRRAGMDEESEQSVIVKDYYCRPVELTGDVKFEDVKIAAFGIASRGDSRIAPTNEEDAIVFLPDGSASSAVIQIGDGKTHYAISIDAATGKATMYFGTTEKIHKSSVDLDAE
jgi:type II secretory pathway pseudopilin PulG